VNHKRIARLCRAKFAELWSVREVGLLELADS